MSGSPEVTPWVVAQYLTGRATSSERDAVEARVHADPDFASTLSAVRQTIVRPAADELGDHARDAAWITLQHALARESSFVARRGVSAHLPRHLGRWMLRGGLAACAAATVIVSVIGLHGRSRPVNASVHTYVTRVSQRATVHLADGTTVSLGPATTLSVADYTGARVAATVHGEALFRVVHRPDHPFVVQSRGAIVRVLGTTFYVRQYAADRTTEIAVVDGRVSAQGRRTPNGIARPASILIARAVGVVSDSGVVTTRTDLDARDYLARVSGELIFRNTPVSVIVGDLSRVYGVEIALADSTLAKRELTFSVDTERRSLDDVLNALTLTLDAHFERVGNTVSVRLGRRAASHPPFPPKLESTYGR